MFGPSQKPTREPILELELEEEVKDKDKDKDTTKFDKSELSNILEGKIKEEEE